jgi:phosphoribosylanthranilate isomerase
VSSNPPTSAPPELNALVVEDSPMMRQLLVFALSRVKQLRVTEADDGVDGLRKLAAGKFDIILTDINMPIMDGLKLVKRVRTRSGAQGRADRDHHDRERRRRSPACTRARRERLHHETDPGSAGDREGQRAPRPRRVMPVTFVKVCGVTTGEDALAAAELGASAIGINFVEGSPRRIDVVRGAAIARAVHDAHGTSVLVVGVVADMTALAMRTLVSDAGIDCLQLHGNEGPELLAPLLPHAYKAIRIATAADVATAERFAGDHILVDAKIDGALGGTGHAFDWSLVRSLARTRKLTLAGGLTPGNVARAIREVQPYCVDVASGVERAPGVKDRDKMRAFIDAAHRA